LLLFAALYLAAAQDCVPGTTTIEGYQGTGLTGGINSGLYLLRGYNTTHTGWLEGEQAKTCYFYTSGLPAEVTIYHNEAPFVDGFTSCVTILINQNCNFQYLIFL
jgi:hypothetical protein